MLASTEAWEEEENCPHWRFPHFTAPRARAPSWVSVKQANLKAQVVEPVYGRSKTLMSDIVIERLDKRT